jgi:hypothetical protein
MVLNFAGIILFIFFYILKIKSKKHFRGTGDGEGNMISEGEIIKKIASSGGKFPISHLIM